VNCRCPSRGEAMTQRRWLARSAFVFMFAAAVAASQMLYH
jgi:hypothetical protein